MKRGPDIWAPLGVVSSWVPGQGDYDEGSSFVLLDGRQWDVREVCKTLFSSQLSVEESLENGSLGLVQGTSHRRAKIGLDPLVELIHLLCNEGRKSCR